MNYDINILLSIPALTLYSIALVSFLYYLIKKKYIPKEKVDQIINLTEYISKNYVELGFKENKNIDFFLKDFVVRYKKDTGIEVSQEIINNALLIIKLLTDNKNNK